MTETYSNYPKIFRAIALFGVLVSIFLCRPIIAKAEVLKFQDTDNFSTETSAIILNPNMEQRFFGRLGSKDQTAYYSVTASKDTVLELELDALKADGDFNPTLTLFGPGLAKPNQDPVIKIGDDNGAIISKVEERGEYFDRNVITSFQIGPRIKAALPLKATYGIAVRSPDGKTGRYALRFKGKDEFKWNQLTDRMSAAFRAIFRMY